MLGVVAAPVIAISPNTMQRRLVRLAVALGLVWLALPAADAAATRRQVPSGFLGVNVAYGAFLTGLVQRCGPGGAFWRARPELAPVPVRD
jgi:hypothetical protein